MSDEMPAPDTKDCPLAPALAHELSVMNELREVRNSVEQIKSALIGNDMGQKGLVQRMFDAEQTIEKHDRKFLKWGTIITSAGVVFVLVKDAVLAFFAGHK